MQIPSRRALEMLHALNKLRNYLLFRFTKKKLKNGQVQGGHDQEGPVLFIIFY